MDFLFFLEYLNSVFYILPTKLFKFYNFHKALSMTIVDEIMAEEKNGYGKDFV